VYLTDKAQGAITDLTAVIERTNNELLNNFPLEEKILFKRFLRDIKE
jgi:hypothetical protein